MSKPSVTHCFVDVRMNAGGKDAWLCPCVTYTIDKDRRFAELISVDMMVRDQVGSVKTVDITAVLPTMILEDITEQARKRQDDRVELDGRMA